VASRANWSSITRTCPTFLWSSARTPVKCVRRCVCQLARYSSTTNKRCLARRCIYLAIAA
jgi:hypothetical protein